MTCLYLVRHGTTDEVDHRFCGRLPGIQLNAEGLQQANRLAVRFQAEPIRAVFSSPCLRARQTADIIAGALLLTVEERHALDEIDIGEWSGRSFDALNREKSFRLFNSLRSTARPPSGELALEVQSRTVTELLRMVQQYEGGAVVIVTHADVIRSALAFFLGVPLDLAHRLAIDLASVSGLRLDSQNIRIDRING